MLQQTAVQVIVAGRNLDLARYVATTEFDRLETAYIASVIQMNWKALSFSDATLTEFVQELTDSQPLVFKEGKWNKVGWSAYQKFDFGRPFGKQDCVPMFMEELRMLPKLIPSLKETGFFVAGFNKLTDNLVIPLSLVLLNLSKKTAKPVGKLFHWSLNTFSKPPYGIVLMLTATGWKDEKPQTLQIKLSHEDSYLLTAVPVIACLLQYLDGSIHKPGLWYQANVVEPKQMLKDIERLGITVEIQKS